jgi:hypothetical protein
MKSEGILVFIGVSMASTIRYWGFVQYCGLNIRNLEISPILWSRCWTIRRWISVKTLGLRWWKQSWNEHTCIYYIYIYMVSGPSRAYLEATGGYSAVDIYYYILWMKSVSLKNTGEYAVKCSSENYIKMNEWMK